MDSSHPESGSPWNDRIAALIHEYFLRRQAGEEITPQSFAAEHPDLAEELRPYLAGLALLREMNGTAPDAPSGPSTTTGELALPTIAGYVLHEEIGHGGMGVVYKALQVSTKRIVALKVTLAGSFATKSVRRRFEREVELAARLQHPGIVRVLESGRVERQRYYAMDYVDGVPLDRYLSAKRHDLRTILSLFIRLCEAVDYAHAHGVIHRDLKPANVLIDDEGESHILDFGLAKAIDQAESDQSFLTQASVSGQIVGTLPYISPEQAAGAPGEVDARTDVYALGVLLYEAVTGSMPYDVTGSLSDVMRRIQEDPPAPPSSFPRRSNGELDTIILKALEKQKDHRYQSAHELGEDLRRYLEGEPILARRPSRLYVLRKRLRKHRVAAAVIVLAMMATVVVLAGLWAESRSRQRELAWARGEALTHQHFMETTAGNPERSIAYAEGLFARFPDLPEARLVYARARHGAESMRDAAIIFLEDAVYRDPSDWSLRLLLAEILEGAGDAQRAELLRVEAEAVAPNTAEGWYVRSFATFDLATALRCAEQAVAREPSHILAWQRLAWLRADTGDLDGALKGADRLIELGHDPTQCAAFKGHVLTRQQKFQEAIEQFGLAQSPRERAFLYQRTGQYEKAVADYTTIIEHMGEPKYVWDYYQRATPLWILGRREEAVEDYRRARVLLGRPTYAEARRFLILHELGQRQEAEEVLAAARRDVEEPWLARIFRCLAGEITPEDLLVYAEELDTLEPLCEASYYAGEVCLRAGRRDHARAFFRQCVQTGLEMDPDTAFGTPMSEYELARWRLRSLFADPAGAIPEDN